MVGTLLNVVNLGANLVQGLDTMTLIRMLANYLIPYCVATFGAVSQVTRDCAGEPQK